MEVMRMEDDKVYKMIEVIGSSPDGFQQAVEAAVKKAAKSLKDLRIVEVVKMDGRIEGDKIVQYRARVKISFKLHDED